MSIGKGVLTALTVISSLTTAALAVAGAIQDHRTLAAQQQQVTNQTGTVIGGIQYQYLPDYNHGVASVPNQYHQIERNMNGGYQDMYANNMYNNYMAVNEQLCRQDPLGFAMRENRVPTWDELIQSADSSGFHSDYINRTFNINNICNNHRTGYSNMSNPGMNTGYYYYNQNPYMNQQQYQYPQQNQNVTGYGYGYSETPVQNAQPTTQQTYQSQTEYQNPTSNSYGYGYSDPTATYFQNQYQNQNGMSNYGYMTSNQYNTGNYGYGYGYGYGYDDTPSYGYANNNSMNNQNSNWWFGGNNNMNTNTGWYSQNQNNNNNYGYGYPNNNYNQNVCQNSGYGYGYGYGYDDTPNYQTYQQPQMMNQQYGYGYGYGNTYPQQQTYQPMQPGTPGFNHWANTVFGDCDYSGYNAAMYQYQQQQRMMYAQQQQQAYMNQQPQRHYQNQNGYWNNNPRNSGVSIDPRSINANDPNLKNMFPQSYQNFNQQMHQRQSMSNPGNPDYVIRTQNDDMNLNSNWFFPRQQKSNTQSGGNVTNMSELDRLFGTNPSGATMLTPNAPATTNPDEPTHPEAIKTPDDHANCNSHNDTRGGDTEIDLGVLLSRGLCGPDLSQEDRPLSERRFTSMVSNPDAPVSHAKHDDVDWAKVAEDAKAKIAAENAERARRHPVDVQKMIDAIHADGAKRSGMTVEEMSDGKVLKSGDIPIPEGAVNAFGPV